MRKGFKKALSFVLSTAMLVSLGSGLDISPAGAEDTTAGTTTEGLDTIAAMVTNLIRFVQMQRTIHGSQKMVKRFLHITESIFIRTVTLLL